MCNQLYKAMTSEFLNTELLRYFWNMTWNYIMGCANMPSCTHSARFTRVREGIDTIAGLISMDSESWWAQANAGHKLDVLQRNSNLWICFQVYYLQVGDLKPKILEVNNEMCFSKFLKNCVRLVIGRHYLEEMPKMHEIL